MNHLYHRIGPPTCPCMCTARADGRCHGHIRAFAHSPHTAVHPIPDHTCHTKARVNPTCHVHCIVNLFTVFFCNSSEREQACTGRIYFTNTHDALKSHKPIFHSHEHTHLQSPFSAHFPWPSSHMQLLAEGVGDVSTEENETVKRRVHLI